MFLVFFDLLGEVCSWLKFCVVPFVLSDVCLVVYAVVGGSVRVHGARLGAFFMALLGYRLLRRLC